MVFVEREKAKYCQLVNGHNCRAVQEYDITPSATLALVVDDFTMLSTFSIISVIVSKLQTYILRINISH